MAGAYTRSAADRDDLAQEMLLGLWKAWPKFRGDSSEKTFAYRVMQNKALDHLRKHYRRSEVPLGEESEVVQTDQAVGEWKTHAADRKLTLAAALKELRVRYRQVAVLALEGMSYREIASVLGISEANAGMRLGRAKAELSRLVGGER